MTNRTQAAKAKGRRALFKLLFICGLLGAGGWLWTSLPPRGAARTATPEAAPDTRREEPERGAGPGAVAGRDGGAAPPRTAAAVQSTAGATGAAAAASEKEVATGDPALRRFVDAAGRTVRELRLDLAGRVLVETRFADDQERSLHRTYDLAGTVVREEVWINGQVTETRTFR